MLMLASLLASAQVSVIDSLQAELEKSGPSVALLNELAWAYMFNKPDTALVLTRQAMHLAQKTNDGSGEAKAHNRMGVAYDVKDMPDSALTCYTRALTKATAVNDIKAMAAAYNNMGMIAWNEGANNKAVELYVKAGNLFEKDGNQKGLSNAYNNLGLILWDEKRLNEALKYHRMAYSIRQKLADKGLIAASLTNIALSFDRLNQVDSALFYQAKAIPLQEEINDNYGLAKSLVNMGTHFLAKGNATEAMNYFLRGLQLHQQAGNKRMVASTHFNIANAYLKQGKRKEYFDELRTTITLSRESGNIKTLWKALNDLGIELTADGLYEEAAKALLERNQIKDSLFTAEKAEQIALLEKQFQTERKDRIIAEQEVGLAQSEKVIADRNRWLAVLVAALSVLALGGGLWLQWSQRKAEREQHAAVMAEREAGLKAVLVATEDERKRIAKDLHDGTVQTLTGLKMRLQRALSRMTLPEADKADLTETIKILDEASAEVRNISHQMMPRVLSESGLIPALADMLDKSLGSTDIRYEFEHHRMDSKRFKEQVEISLFRIAQELINNIIKHSGAKAVSVQLMYVKEQLVLVIEDDGNGFAPTSSINKNGIGLMNISSRVEALHGKLDYSPGNGQGTVATIRVPAELRA